VPYPASHKDLIVWQKSIALASKIYAATGTFRGDQHGDLSNQMRRCAVSIPSNIAEGAARASTNEYIRHLNIARGSLSELETQIYIGMDLQFITPDTHLKEDSAEVGRMLTALVQRLREKRSLDSPSVYGYAPASRRTPQES
jgi:four helix bundle protein